MKNGITCEYQNEYEIFKMYDLFNNNKTKIAIHIRETTASLQLSFCLFYHKWHWVIIYKGIISIKEYLLSYLENKLKVQIYKKFAFI